MDVLAPMKYNEISAALSMVGFLILLLIGYTLTASLVILTGGVCECFYIICDTRNKRL
jgi:hypothetical protein